MRMIVALVSLLFFASTPAHSDQDSTEQLTRCLQAALERKDGTIVKLEVEAAEFSTEEDAAPNGASQKPHRS